MNAPPTSPLIRVDIEDVGLFIIQGIAKAPQDHQINFVHCEMFQICSYISASIIVMIG